MASVIANRSYSCIWLLAFLCLCASGIQSASAQSIIRDTEIENIIDAYATPLLEAGDLPPDSVRIRVIADSTLNAFVTAGNRMYIHTGTLTGAESAGEVIGVIAHEIGHIVGGHAVTFSDQMQAATTTTLLTTLLGVAAGVATGNTDVGMAVALGGQGTAQRQLLAHSRGQESAADQFALKALDESGQSSAGLYRFFQRISGQELLITDRQDPYIRSHPLTRERMSTIASHLNNSPYADRSVEPELEERHQRVVAKIYSFLEPQFSTLRKYPESDLSIPARYARSIAYYRRGQLDKSLPLIDGLIEESPDDPYFWELKGQMLFENGRLAEGIEAYREANRLLPFAPLIQVAMAHAMVETGDPQYVNETQDALRSALQSDPTDVFAWDLSAKSYAINNEPGLSAYAAAERAMLLGQMGDVARYTRQADEYLERGTPVWVRLQDIKAVARNYMDEMRQRRRIR